MDWKVDNSILFLVAIVGLIMISFYALSLQNFDIANNVSNGLIGFIGGVGVGAAGTAAVVLSKSNDVA